MRIKEKMPLSKQVLGQTSKGKRKKNPPFATRPFGCMNISMAKLGDQDGNHLKARELKPRPKQLDCHLKKCPERFNITFDDDPSLD